MTEEEVVRFPLLPILFTQFYHIFCVCFSASFLPRFVEVLVTEEEVGDFLVHCYAQKEKEKNLAIGEQQ